MSFCRLCAVVTVIYTTYTCSKYCLFIVLGVNGLTPNSILVVTLSYNFHLINLATLLS